MCRNLLYTLNIFLINLFLCLQSYLKIAKINRVRVLLEVSLKLIARLFIEISQREIHFLESELNRFYTTYPMPGEECLLEEYNEDEEQMERRMPLKIIDDKGSPKIDINEAFQIDPYDFLAVYLKKMMNYLKFISELKVKSLNSLFIKHCCFSKAYKVRDIQNFLRYFNFRD